MLFGKEKQKGISVLVIIGIVFVAIIIVAVVFRFFIITPESTPKEEEEEPKPQYEVTTGNVKFIFKEAINRGDILSSSEGEFKYHREKELTTTENFIQVTVGATNVGKENIDDREWHIKEIVDEEGRIFESMNPRETEPWLPKDNDCDAVLKPGFTPSLCTKMYEVAKVSKRLKIRVASGERGNKGEGFLDLFVVPQGEI